MKNNVGRRSASRVQIDSANSNSRITTRSVVPHCSIPCHCDSPRPRILLFLQPPVSSLPTGIDAMFSIVLADHCSDAIESCLARSSLKTASVADPADRRRYDVEHEPPHELGWGGWRQETGDERAEPIASEKKNNQPRSQFVDSSVIPCTTANLQRPKRVEVGTQRTRGLEWCRNRERKEWVAPGSSHLMFGF